MEIIGEVFGEFGKRKVNCTTEKKGFGKEERKLVLIEEFWDLIGNF